MKLRDIADIDSDSEVSGFAIDHRKVARGSVFGAFRGAVFDGEDFIQPAVERGAVAVVARPEAIVERVPHLADAQPRRLNLRSCTGRGVLFWLRHIVSNRHGSVNRKARAAAWTVVEANIAWAIASVVVVATDGFSPTTGGSVWIVLQALTVAGFAALQAFGLKRG